MRVLAPLDGSEASYAALDRGLAILHGAPGLEVTLLNVIQEGFDEVADPELVEETFAADDEDEVFPDEASSQRALARGLVLARKHGLGATLRSEVGRPQDVILREAAAHDLLLMHALSPSHLRDALRGTGTEHLARHAPCAVLLVRA